MLAGCGASPTPPPFHHVAGLDCAKCHQEEQKDWSSPQDLHAASAAEVLGVADHNIAEVPKDDCLLCHAMFQAVSLRATVDPTGTVPGTKIPTSVYGPVDDTSQTYYSGAISHFLSPVNSKGPWTITSQSDWQATKCEVCHEPSSNDIHKLAKYGTWLDSQPKAGYIELDTGMPVAYNYVLQNSAYVRNAYEEQSALSIHATKLCDSCHDPDDQGGDPAKVINGKNYGPQGGDSRAYVTANHAGLGCIDCHKGHTFTPENSTQAQADTNCIGLGCHNERIPAPTSPADPGVVHTNHIP
jgi:hypothetical protein